jgi:hypothetical protein
MQLQHGEPVVREAALAACSETTGSRRGICRFFLSSAATASTRCPALRVHVYKEHFVFLPASLKIKKNGSAAGAGRAQKYAPDES